MPAGAVAMPPPRITSPRTRRDSFPPTSFRFGLTGTSASPIKLVALLLVHARHAHSGLPAVLLPATSLSVRAAESPVILTVDTQHPGATIARRFSGLSYEVAALLPVNGVRYFRPDNAPLLALFRTLGLKSLRIGGNTSDRNARQLPSEADWDSLFAFAKAADAKVIYCLRLHEGDPAIGAATVSYIMKHYAGLVDAFSIGQEPSAYPMDEIDPQPAGEGMDGAAEKFPFEAYRDQWEKFAVAIATATPAVRFCGPGVHNNAGWMRRFLEEQAGDPHVALLTGHLYPGGAAGRLPSAEAGRERMLSGEFFAVYEKLHGGFAPAAMARGLPYRFEEVNSYFNGGAQGASDTFAAALWGLEFMHWWAAHEAAGLNFHTGDRVAAGGDIQPPRYAAFQSAPGGFAIRPLAYALKAFDLGGHGRILPLTIRNSAMLNLTAYATLAGDQTLAITVINKEHGSRARDTVVTLAGATLKSSRAQVLFLQSAGGSIAATDGITLGGAAIDQTGSWSGAWHSIAPPATGDALQIKIPAASAAVVRLSR